MPWQEVTKMSSKLEFATLAAEKKEPFSRLCKRFNISRKTGYKLLNRYLAENKDKNSLQEQSRRPIKSPKKTRKTLEKKIVSVRQEKPYWGGRKIRAWLLNNGEKDIPAASTISNILHRHNLITQEESLKRVELKRFEHECANDLWQADFKGHFPMHKGRCHPLTILDDHSRFAIGLRACGDEKRETIMPHFIEIFEHYGLPYRINFDNGSPWATAHKRESKLRYTEFTIWLIRLGIRVSYSRIRHPQTNGKDERFHRTLKHELLQYNVFFDLTETQRRFNIWRDEYNIQRPHEALGMKAPILRYSASNRKYIGKLPDIEYPSEDEVQMVNRAGNINYKNKRYFISESFKGLPVGLRVNRENDKQRDVYFCHQKILTLDPTKD